MKTLNNCIVLLLLLGTFSCGSTSNDKESQNNNASSTTTTEEIGGNPGQGKEVQIDTALTAFSNFLAANERFTTFQDSTLRNRFLKWAEDNKVKYEKIKANRLDKISKWNEENMKALNSNHQSFLFYPLAGGDFIHMSFLFPEAKEYLMLALEPVGSVPVKNGSLGSFEMDYLMDVDKVLRNIYRQSYFVTKNMNSDMGESTKVNGVLPLILWGMGKTDHSIVSLSYFDIDSTGQKCAVQNPKKPTGVRIEFIKNGTSLVKSLEYLSMNVANSAWKSNPRNKRYLENAVPQGCNSFIKSASYILHYRSFSEMRDLILSKTKFHLQDDTGIPYTYFDSTFTASLFGEYIVPVEDFDPKLFQKDLDVAYKDESKYKGDLPFSMGYHWGSRKQNQMIFSRPE